MMSLILAAAAAAQPVPNAPAQQMPMSHAQHEGMKKDCCKDDCCEDMAAKEDGHPAEHDGHAAK